MTDDNPQKIQEAVKFVDGRYFLACTSGRGTITHAYCGYPGDMETLKVHQYEVYRDGGSFDLTTSIGRLYFDFKFQKFEFDCFKDEQNGSSEELNKAIDRGIVEWGTRGVEVKDIMNEVEGSLVRSFIRR